MPIRLLLAWVTMASATQTLFALAGAPAPPGKEYATTNGYSLWIPDGVEQVRGIIAVCSHEMGIAIYQDKQTWGPNKGNTLGYRDLAKRLSFAIMVFNRDRKPADHYAVLVSFSATTGHAEVKHAVLFPTGLSAGGFYACDLAAFDWSRVIGFFPIAGAPGSVAATPAGLSTPGLFINQGRDSFYPGSGVNTLRPALAGRAKGALWSGLIVPGVEHHNIHQHDFMLVWIEEIAKLRLPANLSPSAPPKLQMLTESEGWLGTMKWHDTKGEQPLIVDNVAIGKFSTFTSDKTQMFWFPNERTASAWHWYLTHEGDLSNWTFPAQRTQ